MINQTFNPSIDFGIQTAGNIFSGTSFFGADWLLALIIIGLSMLLVTRDLNDWKTLALPMSLMWMLAGLHVNLLIIITTSIFFAIDVLSTKTLGTVLSSVTAAAKGLNVKEYALEKQVEKARKDTARSRALFDKQTKTLQEKSKKAKLKETIAALNEKQEKRHYRELREAKKGGETLAQLRADLRKRLEEETRTKKKRNIK